jgi:polysaccharide biosynthesis protein PslH
MKLLFVMPQLPYPPHQGTAIRNWGLLRHLALRHTVAVICFADPGGAGVPEALARVCDRVVIVPRPTRWAGRRVLALLRGTADLADRLWSPGMAAGITELVRAWEPDGVQIEGLEMAPYLAAVREGRLAACVVYDAHNAEHLIQRRAWESDRRNPRRWPAAAYSAVQTPRLERLEAATARAVDAATCVSAADAAALRRLDPDLNPVVVPNGIDVEAYAAPNVSDPGVRLVLTGKMDYRPNVDAAVWFAEAIWPRLRAQQLAAEFHIVGQQPSAAVRRLAALPGVVVTGAVPDIRPHLARATVYVAPLRMGGGTRFKLLEAFALGRPVVSTRIGAEGFAVTDGRELLLADTAEAFAAAVQRLLADPALAGQIGAAGRAFVRASYDWRMIVPRLEAVYAGLLAKP